MMNNPKTWSELIKEKDIFTEFAEICSSNGKDESKTFTDLPIEKAALALLKIYHLIEEGYGGNLTREEIMSPTQKYAIIHDGKRFIINRYLYGFYHISFHTWEQANEFLRYPENIQLLNDYNIV